MMKRESLFLAAAGVAASLASVQAVQAVPFTAGDLVVFQVNPTGATSAPTSAATEDVLTEYTLAGAPLQSIPLPTTSSGTASSEGELTLGPTGYLAVPGYNVAAGTASVASTVPSTTANQRAVNIVDANGNIDSTTLLSDAYSGNNIRSATYDGTNLYTAGTAASGSTATAGIRQTTPNATTSTQIESAFTNTRVVQEVGGNIYFSTGSATAGIYEVAGTPTSSGQTPVLIAADSSSSASPYDFYFTSLTGAGAPTGINTLYVADSTTGSTAAAGSILKYSLVGGTWTLNGSVNIPGGTGAVADEITGLAGTTAGAVADLYSSSPTNIYSYVDASGYDAAPSATTPLSIATAPTNTAFRGIALVPTAVPEPASLGLIGLAAGALLARRRRA